MKLYLVGGFLGSGKTTAIQQACMELLGKQAKTAVITNDQGSQLIDSAFIKSFSIPNKEVTNGCFCCNYNELDKHIQSLQKTDQPEVIFAESVGSCTDMIATVVKPLEQFHPDMDIVVSIFADATLLLKLSPDSQSGFDESVDYIYQKQLVEADILIISKIDLLTKEQLEYLNQIIKKQYPDMLILFQNSFDKENIRNWLSALNNFPKEKNRISLEIDYNIYGEGEAKMAWLDDEIEIRTNDKGAVSIGVQLVNKIFTKIKAQEYPIGHLKFLINDGHRQIKISFTSNDADKWKPASSIVETDNIILLINARVQTTPALLKKLVADAIQELSIESNYKISRRKLAAFQPGFPKPTHRILD